MTGTDLDPLIRVLHSEAARLSEAADGRIDTGRAWRDFQQLCCQAGRRRRRRLTGAAIAVAAAVAAAAVAVPALDNGRSQRESTLPLISGRGTPPASPASPAYWNAVSARIPVAGVEAMVQDGTWLWGVQIVPPPGPVAERQFRLIKIDLRTGKVVLGLGLGPAYRTVAAAGGSVWLTTAQGEAAGQVVRIDPATGKVIKTLHLPAGHCGYVTFAAGQLWAECGSGRSGSVFFGLNPVTGLLDSQLGPVRGAAGTIVVTPQSVWYPTDSGLSGIIAPTPASPGPRVVTVTDPAHQVDFAYTQSLVYSGGAVWALTSDESVAKIDPATGHVLRIFTYLTYDPGYEGGLDFLAVGQGSLWFLDDGYPTSGVLRVSMATGKPLGAVYIKAGSCGQPCSQIYDSGGTIWVPTLTEIIGIDPARMPG